MRLIPLCNSCGTRHYNFRPCAVRDEAKAEAKARKPLHVVYRENSEWRPFGDRLLNYENRGGNLHLLPPRKAPDGEEAA